MRNEHLSDEKAKRKTHIDQKEPRVTQSRVQTFIQKSVCLHKKSLLFPLCQKPCNSCQVVYLSSIKRQPKSYLFRFCTFILFSRPGPFFLAPFAMSCCFSYFHPGGFLLLRQLRQKPGHAAAMWSGLSFTALCCLLKKKKSCCVVVVLLRCPFFLRTALKRQEWKNGQKLCMLQEILRQPLVQKAQKILVPTKAANRCLKKRVSFVAQRKCNVTNLRTR